MSQQSRLLLEQKARELQIAVEDFARGFS